MENTEELLGSNSNDYKDGDTNTKNIQDINSVN